MQFGYEKLGLTQTAKKGMLKIRVLNPQLTGIMFAGVSMYFSTPASVLIQTCTNRQAYE